MNPIFDQRIGTKSYFFGSRNCQNFGFGGFGQILAFPNKSFWCFGKISLSVAHYSSLPLVSGVWVMSWSMNCPHCMSMRVKSVLGRFRSAINASLIALGEGRMDLDSEIWPRGTETPARWHLLIFMLLALFRICGVSLYHLHTWGREVSGEPRSTCPNADVFGCCTSRRWSEIVCPSCCTSCRPPSDRRRCRRHR